MDDSRGDFLDRNDQNTRNVEYIDEVDRIDREIFEDDLSEFESDMENAVGPEGVLDVTVPDNISHFIREIRIPEGTRVIQRGTFSNLRNLRDVYLPKSLREVEVEAFDSGVNTIENVHVEDLAAFCRIKFSRTGGANPLGHGANLVVDGKVVEDLSIPEGIDEIGCGQFMKCRSIRRVHIPDGLKLIDRDAFSGCRNLVEVNIPESVEAIHRAAFAHSGLKEFPIGRERKNDIKVSEFAFSYTDIQEVYVPKSVTVSNDLAFSN